MINQKKDLDQKDQANYMGRWVEKATFRAFVYDAKGNEKLANSYKEFESLIASGLWYESKPDASSKQRKQKDASTDN